MKDLFRKLCWPILRLFETGQEARGYRPSHRKILLAVGILFLFLSSFSLYLGIAAALSGAAIPVSVFSVVSLVCIVVALLGSDAAVARIWGSRSDRE